MTTRGYFVYESDCGMVGVAVVATSSKEAKRIGWNELSGDGCDDYIDLRVRWLKNADVSGIEIGIVKDIASGLRRGLYNWCDDIDCDICGVNTHVYGVEGVIMCCACQNEMLLGYHREAVEIQGDFIDD